MTDDVQMSTVSGVATITFNRPAKRNAISVQMWKDLQVLVARADQDRLVGITIIRGAGGHFTAGADLEEYEIVHATRDSSIRYLNMTSEVIRNLLEAKKPLVAMIEGACMGGGCLIALACDLRYAANNSCYCLPPAKIGVAFPVADTKRIIDIVGPAVARDLLFSARVVDASEALAMGLLNEVFPPTDLEQQVGFRVDRILANSQWSVLKAKEIIGRILSGQFDDTDETRGWLYDALDGADFKEGRRAFMEKRPPKYNFSK